MEYIQVYYKSVFQLLYKGEVQMINFASLFNQIKNSSPSIINQLLDNPDTTLEQILDDDSFPNEYKCGNTKAFKFMNSRKFKQMVKFLTEVGPADDQKRSYKYPLVACDILSAENVGSIEYFFPDNELFEEQIIEEQQQIDKEQQPQESAEKIKQETQMVDQTVRQDDKEPKTVIKDYLEENVEPPEGTAPESTAPEEKSNNDNQGKQIQPKEQTQEEQTKEQAPSPKKIKVKAKVQRIQKLKVEPLIDHLFRYYEGEINYTLAGYVSKVLGTFYSKKSLVVMRYLLHQKRFQQLLNHVQSRSVGELITKIMIHQSADLEAQRKQAFQLMLARLSEDKEIHVMSTLSQCICEIIEKIALNIKGQNPILEFGSIYFNVEVILSLITNVMSQEENVCVYNAPVLLTYLMNAPLNISDNQQLQDQFKQLLNKFLVKAISKLRVTKQIRTTLGFGRLKIIEIISFVLRTNLLQFRNTVGSNKQLFPTLLRLLQDYQMNNILHNQVVKIIELALCEDQKSPFLRSLLEDDILLNFIVQQAQFDIKIRAGEISRKTRKGYICHVISICHNILEKSNSNEAIDTLSEKEQFKKVVEDLVEKEIGKQRKPLAGFHTIKKPVSNILFMKQQITQAHFKFLSACSPPVYEPEPENVNIQHPDLEVSHAMTFDNAADAVQAILSVRDSQNHYMEIPQRLQTQYIDLNPKYWVNHLTYDLDELMSDL